MRTAEDFRKEAMRRKNITELREVVDDDEHEDPPDIHQDVNLWSDGSDDEKEPERVGISTSSDDEEESTDDEFREFSEDDSPQVNIYYFSEKITE